MEIEEKEKTIGELRKKLEEYAKYAQEVRHLRDEADLLREQASKVPELEDRVKKLQVKSEGIVDLKKQLKLLQEQNDKYLNTNLELEESAKKLPILKAQLDKYKEQVATLSASQSSLNNNLKDKGKRKNDKKQVFLNFVFFRGRSSETCRRSKAFAT